MRKPEDFLMVTLALVVQTFDDAAGEQLLSAEIVEDEFAMRP